MATKADLPISPMFIPITGEPIVTRPKDSVTKKINIFKRSDDLKGVIDQLNNNDKKFLSPLDTETDYPAWNHSDATHLDFMDLQLETDLELSIAATKFGPLNHYLQLKNHQHTADSDWYRAYFGGKPFIKGQPAEWMSDIRPTPYKKGEYDCDKVKAESYNLWRWTRDTIASVMSVWRTCEAVKNKTNPSAILKELFVHHGHNCFFLPPQIKFNLEPDVIPFIPKEYASDIPKREELENKIGFDEHMFNDKRLREKYIEFLNLYVKYSIARLSNYKTHMSHSSGADEIIKLADDFPGHGLTHPAIMKTLDAYCPVFDTLQEHIFKCLAKHIAPKQKIPKFVCCPQCHTWTRRDEKSPVKNKNKEHAYQNWGGKLYCSPRCRSAGTYLVKKLMEHRNKDYLLSSAIDRVQQLLQTYKGRAPNKFDQREKADLETKISDCIYENLRRAMSPYRILEGHFLLTKTDTTLIEAKLFKLISQFSYETGGYHYFDWDTSHPEHPDFDKDDSQSK